MKILRLFPLVILLFLLKPVKSQELFCSIEVNISQIQGVDKKIFEAMRSSLYEFMNSRVWTNYQYRSIERIECSMLLTITEAISLDEFKGSLTLALRRPVFNSTYNTVLFNFIDKDIQFKYSEYESLDFDENTFFSNLTSILGFYAYLFIGLDFDSFSLEGGNPYFQAAQNIVNLAQNTNYKGWKSFENQRNRYWIIENLTNPAYKPVRKFFYEYHLKGLDKLYDDTFNGRTAMLNSLKYLLDIKKQRAGLIILQIIADSKRDEFVNVFSEGQPMEKTQAITILKEIDPANSAVYQKIGQ